MTFIQNFFKVFFHKINTGQQQIRSGSLNFKICKKFKTEILIYLGAVHKLCHLYRRPLAEWVIGGVTYFASIAAKNQEQGKGSIPPHPHPLHPWFRRFCLTSGAGSIAAGGQFLKEPDAAAACASGFRKFY